MALPYPTKVVLPFDIATAQDMNERHANDEALANGTGLDNGAVTPDKIDFAKRAVGDWTAEDMPHGTTRYRRVMTATPGSQGALFNVVSPSYPSGVTQSDVINGHFSYSVVRSAGGSNPARFNYGCTFSPSSIDVVGLNTFSSSLDPGTLKVFLEIEV